MLRFFRGSHEPHRGGHSAILIGIVQGDIHDSHLLWLGRGAVVLGDIHARRAEIEGLVCGDVSATEELIVSAPGVVLGRTQSMQSASGSGAGKGLLSLDPDALHAALKAVDLPPELLFEVYEWVAQYRPRDASDTDQFVQHPLNHWPGTPAVIDSFPSHESDRVLAEWPDERPTDQGHPDAPRIRSIIY